MTIMTTQEKHLSRAEALGWMRGIAAAALVDINASDARSILDDPTDIECLLPPNFYNSPRDIFRAVVGDDDHDYDNLGDHDRQSVERGLAHRWGWWSYESFRRAIVMRAHRELANEIADRLTRQTNGYQRLMARQEDYR